MRRNSAPGRGQRLGTSPEERNVMAQNVTHISGLNPAKWLVNQIQLKQCLIYFSGMTFKE